MNNIYHMVYCNIIFILKVSISTLNVWIIKLFSIGDVYVCDSNKHYEIISFQTIYTHTNKKIFHFENVKKET